MAKTNKVMSSLGDRVSDLNDVGVTDIITDPLLTSENYDSTEATRLGEEFWKAFAMEKGLPIRIRKQKK